MNICILTLGTRGDVQPYLALAVALKRLGHHVRLATGPSFKAFVERHGIEFFPLSADYLQLTESEEGKKALSSNFIQGYQLLKSTIMPMIEQVLKEATEAASTADFLIFHPKSLAGPHLMEHLKVPGVLAATVPMFSPTALFPLPAMLPPGLHLGGVLNRMSYGLVDQSTRMFQGVLGNWRKSLGLSAQPASWSPRSSGKQKLDVLYCVSPVVFPRPHDWDARSHLAGFWILEEQGYTPPAELEAFLKDTGPKVYVGFGSMTHADPQKLTDQVLQMARNMGVKVVMSTATSALQASKDEHIFPIASVPHEWLFKRLDAVVHHGGLGTTAATLRAGVPSVICPVGTDQPFLAHTLHRQQLTAPPIPHKKITAKALQASLEEALEGSLKTRLKPIQEKLLAEDGARRTAEWITQHMAKEKTRTV